MKLNLTNKAALHKTIELLFSSSQFSVDSIQLKFVLINILLNIKCILISFIKKFAIHILNLMFYI